MNKNVQNMTSTCSFMHDIVITVAGSYNPMGIVKLEAVEFCNCQIIGRIFYDEKIT